MCAPLSQLVLIGCLELIHFLLPLLHVVPTYMAKKLNLVQMASGDLCATLLRTAGLPLLCIIISHVSCQH